MAYTETALSSADIALAVADKPILCGYDPLTIPDARWVSGASPVWTTDASDADFPAARMVDRYTHLPSKGGSAVTVWGAIFHFPATCAYDIIAITGHNLGDLTLTTITYEVADDTAFTTNLKTVSTFANPSDNKRMIDMQLDTGDEKQYTGEHYGRLVITAPGTITPELGEVYFLRRRQLARKPNRPYDTAGPHVTMGESFRSQSGVETFYPHSRGQRLLRANLNPDVTADQTTLRAVFSDSDYGTEPIIWIEEPASAPEEFLICNFSGSERSFHLPFIGPHETETDIALDEQGPEEFYLSRET